MKPSSQHHWRTRWLLWRNRILASPRFQRSAAALALTRWVARRRAARLFDLTAGLAYSQVLAATVESGLLELLAGEAKSSDSLAAQLGLSEEATLRLLRAAAALNLAQEAIPGVWTQGEQGAALSGNPGAQAMIRHHRLLYADLADPLALLRDGRTTPTRLSQFWSYAAREEAASHPYSELMAASQAMVAEQVVAAYRFARHRALLDIGGGYGVFLRAVAANAPQLRLGHFDLPNVSARAQNALRGLPHVEFHPGDFLQDALPQNYDLISLVRVLHDHDDSPAQALLTSIRRTLPRGGRLLLAEPMAGTRGAKAMGEAYFGMYLWAMGAGRPRRRNEIGAMLERAGFVRWREVPTRLPLVARIIVADA